MEFDLFRDAIPGKLREGLGLNKDAILLCSIGQLIPWKGHDLLIQAFRKIVKDSNYYLIIVGGNLNLIWSVTNDYLIYPTYLKRLVQGIWS